MRTSPPSAGRPSPRRRLLALAVGAAALLAPVPALAAPQEDPPPPSEGELSPEEAEARRRARERWEKLSSEERRELIERYERFRTLSPEQRDELRRRLEDLGGPQGIELVRDKLEEARESSPEHLESLRRRAAYLERFEARMLEVLPEDLRARYEALETEAREDARRRSFGALMGLGRRIFVEKYATPEERKTLLEDPSGREGRRIMGQLWARARERVITPEKARLDALSPEDRRREEAALWDRAYWTTMGQHAAEVAAAVAGVLDRPGGEKSLDERFEETFGVAPGAIGVEEAPRALLWALHLVPKARRERFLSTAREGLKRIAALPEAERATAFRELLSRLRREDPPEPPPPRER